MGWTPQHQAPTIFPGSRDPHGCTSALLPPQGGANAHPWKEASLSHLNPIAASSLGQSPLPLPRPQDCQDSRANAEGTAPVLSFKTGKLRLGSRRDLSQAPMFTAEPQPEPVLGWVLCPRAESALPGSWRPPKPLPGSLPLPPCTHSLWGSAEGEALPVLSGNPECGGSGLDVIFPVASPTTCCLGLCPSLRLSWPCFIFHHVVTGSFGKLVPY